MMTIKKWLHDNAYWITPLNTVLIIVGISISVLQRVKIKDNTETTLKNQEIMIKGDSMRFQKQDSAEIRLRAKLDSMNIKQ